MNFWRKSSLLMRLMPHFMPRLECMLSLSDGPNMARHFHQVRLTASCTMSRCAWLPFIITSRAS